MAEELAFGADAAKSFQAGDGVDRPVFTPFQRVECDAHQMDCIPMILLPNVFGG